MLCTAFAFLSDGSGHGKSLSIACLSQFETPFAFPWKIHFMEEVQANPPQIPCFLGGGVDNNWLA